MIKHTNKQTAFLYDKERFINFRLSVFIRLYTKTCKYVNGFEIRGLKSWKPRKTFQTLSLQITIIQRLQAPT